MLCAAFCKYLAGLLWSASTPITYMHESPACSYKLSARMRNEIMSTAGRAAWGVASNEQLLCAFATHSSVLEQHSQASSRCVQQPGHDQQDCSGRNRCRAQPVQGC